MELGLQLYSLRGIVENDTARTLEQVAKMGYSKVEFAGYYGLKADEMAKMLAANGLRAVSTHVSTKAIEENLDQEIEYNLAVGNHDLVVAYSGIQNAEDTKKLAELLSKSAAKCAEYDMHIGYHNHNHEFERTDGGVKLIDLLAEYSDKSVQFEFDVYWVSFAGSDPMEYLKKYAGRQRLMHLKELSKDEPKRNVEIGDGKIDFASLITEGKKLGILNFIVEQEAYTMPQLESCARSLEGIKKLGLL